MNKYIKDIKNKFGYSDELSNFLKILIPNLILFFGSEYKNIILSALLNCEIHFQKKGEKIDDFLNLYFNTNKEWKIPELTGAFYHKEINIKDNNLMSKSIIYLRCVYYGKYIPFNFNDINNIDSLTHEICHLIKGYNKEKIENEKIIDSTGLMQNIYSYNHEMNIIEEKMVGIEEALNTAETTQILEMITGKKQNVKGYKTAGYLANKLLEYKDFAKVIKKSQLNGDNNWMQYFGDEQSKMLIDNFDILINLMYVSWKDINKKEKRDLLKQQRIISRDAILSFIDDLF